MIESKLQRSWTDSVNWINWYEANEEQVKLDFFIKVISTAAISFQLCESLERLFLLFINNLPSWQIDLVVNTNKLWNLWSRFLLVIWPSFVSSSLFSIWFFPLLYHKMTQIYEMQVSIDLKFATAPLPQCHNTQDKTLIKENDANQKTETKFPSLINC